MSKGFVYILTNDSMPGLIKIGKTTMSPYERAQQISSSTGVPTAFQVAYYREVDDCHTTEQCLHKDLASYRVNNNREFFSANVEYVAQIMDEYSGFIGSSGGSFAIQKKSQASTKIKSKELQTRKPDTWGKCPSPHPNSSHKDTQDSVIIIAYITVFVIFALAILGAIIDS